MLNVSPHLSPSHRCSSGASESGSQKVPLRLQWEGIITMVLELPIQVCAIPHIPPRSVVIPRLLASERVQG